MIRADVTCTIKSGCTGIDKTENSEITTMSHDVPMVSLKSTEIHDGATRVAPRHNGRAVVLYL